MLSNCVSFCTLSSLCVVRERYSNCCEFVQQGDEVHSTETSRCESFCVVKLCVVSVFCVCSDRGKDGVVCYLYCTCR